MNKWLYKSKVFLKKNGSTILTVAGGVGVVATSVMAVKATPKALYLLEQAKEEKGKELTKFESVQVAGPVYIPSIIIGASTIACVFGANALNKRQQAALMSAYALLDNSYKEYKAKVKGLYSEDADTMVKNSIAKDKYEKEEIVVDDGKRLFYDEFSGRYFESTSEDVIKAEYELNREMASHGGVYLNRFYELLNIPTTEEGKTLGWSLGILSDTHWAYWIEFDHDKVVMDDGLECYIIRMRHEPVADFAYY